MDPTWLICSHCVSNDYIRKRLHINAPSVKHYPSWLPGGQFHKDAEAAKIVSQKVRHIPFDMVRNEMVCFPLPLLNDHNTLLWLAA